MIVQDEMHRFKIGFMISEIKNLVSLQILIPFRNTARVSPRMTVM